MGSGKCVTQVRPFVRLHSCLVVYYRLDDFRSWKLPGRQPSPVTPPFSVFTLPTQTTANYIVSLLAVWETDFPGGISIENVKWRAFVWAVSEGLLILAIAINYLPPRMYSMVFKFSIGLMMLDFLLCLIWLPIGVSRTYGFRSARDVFTATCELKCWHPE